MTKSDTLSAFATLRFAGDNLDPDEISRVLDERPTRAYRKGQRFRPGPRSPEVVGKTGVWYLSTERKVSSKDLGDHLDALLRLVFPFAEGDQRLRVLRALIQREHLQAHVTCFWRGPAGAPQPSVPARVKKGLNRLPADIETDFAEAI